MNYLHFIPHVNRIDLTSIALNSVKNIWDRTIIIDNSNDITFGNNICNTYQFEFNIIKPIVPLNTAQTYNMMRIIGIQQNMDFISFMHNDCEVLTENGDLLLINHAIEQFSETNNKIGLVNYNTSTSENKGNDDLFCAYRTDMLKDVGEWDWLCFPFYFLDIDYFKRMNQKGWKTFTIKNLHCKHHNLCSTVKSDKVRWLSNPYFYVASDQLMNIKWNDYDGNWDNLKDD